MSTIRGRIHIKRLFIGGFVKSPNTDAYTEGTAATWSLVANGGGWGRRLMTPQLGTSRKDHTNLTTVKD